MRWDRFEEGTIEYSSSNLIVKPEYGIQADDIHDVLTAITVIISKPCPYRLDLNLSEHLKSDELAHSIT